jgi:hypothetical protein
MRRSIVPTAQLEDLRRIPGIGPSLARDLFDLGIHRVSDLHRRNPRRCINASAIFATLIKTVAYSTPFDAPSISPRKHGMIRSG